MIKGKELITYLTQIQLFLFCPTMLVSPFLFSKRWKWRKTRAQYYAGPTWKHSLRNCHGNDCLLGKHYHDSRWQNKIASWGYYSVICWTDEKQSHVAYFTCYLHQYLSQLGDTLETWHCLFGTGLSHSIYFLGTSTDLQSSWFHFVTTK